MNLYFRLLIAIVRAFLAPKLKYGEAVELELRVMPTDLDPNMHMTNARYLSMVDLALITMFIRSGYGRLLVRNKWKPMGGGSVIYFRRGLNPFQRFTLRFSPVGWDEFWNYFRFEFIRGGELCAVGFVKGAATGPSGLVRNADVYPVLGVHQPSPAFPADLQAWIAADRQLGEHVKRAAP